MVEEALSGCFDSTLIPQRGTRVPLNMTGVEVMTRRPSVAESGVKSNVSRECVQFVTLRERAG